MWQFLNSKVEDTWFLELLKVLPSVLVAAVVGGCTLYIAYRQYELAKKEKDLTGNARYLAIRIVCILDRYVDDCAKVTTDSGWENKEGFTYPNVKDPDVPKYPTDVNWKSIDPNLMYKIFSLPVAAERAASYIEGASENCSTPDNSELFEERTRQYGPLGLQAHSLSQTLKKHYGIAVDVVENRYWNPVEAIQEELTKLSERDASRAALPSLI